MLINLFLVDVVKFFVNMLQVVPTGFANLLRWCKSSYNDPPIYITENGFSDRGTLEDYGRIQYFNVRKLNLIMLRIN
jgi:beta-glucosidase/6-phospho-beta-glucosidase/beta-galactosidase